MLTLKHICFWNELKSLVLLRSFRAIASITPNCVCVFVLVGGGAGVGRMCDADFMCVFVSVWNHSSHRGGHG